MRPSCNFGMYSFRACIFNIIRGPEGTGETEVHATYLRYVEFFFPLSFPTYIIFSLLILLVLAFKPNGHFFRITSCVRVREIKIIQLIYA